MTISLIPEKPLLISPSLAATIGLEEAALLHILSDVFTYRDTTFSDGFDWVVLDLDLLRHAMPFWSDMDIQRISKSLRDKGIILIGSAPFGCDRVFKFALNENSKSAHAHQTSHSTVPREEGTFSSQSTTQSTAQKDRATEQAKRRKNDPFNPSDYIAQIKSEIDKKQTFADSQYSRHASIIPPNWRPSDDVLKQIGLQGIPQSFAVTQVPEFVTYWTERRESHFSWGSKFVNRVIRKWREHQTEVASQEQTNAISVHWLPSDDALQILQRLDIPHDFVEDAIPEFVLYWTERGDPSKTWNSKFISHVKLQWARFNSVLEHDTQPVRIATNWQPSHDVYDVLKLANIDLSFAQNLVKEFVIFWRDANELSRSWNTKFLQHVKYHWAKQHNLATGQLTNPTGDYHARQQNSPRSSHQPTSGTFERLTDRSWADGLKGNQ